MRRARQELRLAQALLAAVLLAGCATSAPQRQDGGLASLRFIGEQRLPHRMDFQGTVVGGLSGLDYDARGKTWYIVSDDRSEHSPARFYTARLDYDAAGFRTAALTGVRYFRAADGAPYPNERNAAPGQVVPDVEAGRIDPIDGSLWYASEGRKNSPASHFIRRADADGDLLSTLPLPSSFMPGSQRRHGMRDNLGLEAMSFAVDGSLWIAAETSLLQDGEVASPSAGALVRLARVDRAGRLLAQYVYPLDPIPLAPAPGKLADNGLSEILALDGRRLLALERSGVQGADGVFRFHIRLYQVELDGATDVGDAGTLEAMRFTPVRKRLLLDFGKTPPPGGKADNLEGMAWGPVLENGHRSLVLLSDDNFHPSQATQFLAFELLSD